MNPDGIPLLDLPASTASACLVRATLVEAQETLDRLHGGHDVDALHDFRVSIRRLRCLLRAHHSSLGKVASRKLQKRLSDLAAATNECRDAEVQLDWLEARRQLLSRSERSGLNWLLRRLRAKKKTGLTSAVRLAKTEFATIAADITRRLDRMPPVGRPFREAAGSLWKKHAARLVQSLAAIRSVENRKAIHAARNRTKRARSLIDPLRGETGSAKALLKSLKHLQDVLGNLHDAHVLEAALETALDDASFAKARKLRDLALAGDLAAGARERRRDERRGLVALARLVRVHRDDIFAAFRAHWTDTTAEAFAGDAAAFANTIFPPPTGAAATPVECERKYLLKALPPFVHDAEVREIDQGWLPGQTLRERIRRTRDGGSERFFRTVKLGTGVTRIEIEEECERTLFDAMWPLTAGCRIRKRRYLVPVGDKGRERIWEIDEFLDRDLALAEIELASEDEAVDFPQWLAPFVDREVTEEGSFTNLALALTSS